MRKLAILTPTTFTLAAAVFVAADLAVAPSALAAQEAVVFDSADVAGLGFRSIGPPRGGRSTAVAGITEQPLTYFMGATGGGVWRTDDAGLNWRNISDGYIGTGAIGSIDVADSDANVIYVGTGSSCIRGNISKGIGIYRSTNGGDSWTHIGLPNSGQIGDIKVHPHDADIAFVAALGDPFGPNPERGVFRTTDGGDTWDHVLAISDSTGAVDLAINPSNPRIVFASAWRAERKPWTATSGSEESGVFRSTDGGDTWNRLEGGLPTGLVGKSAVTVSRANPDRVWVLIEASDDRGGVYRSEDGGDTWRRVNSDRGLLQRAWYYTHIYADPVDENTVYALNVGYNKSVDGGVTWQSYGVPHGDVHDLWINYEDPDFQVVANDGGGQVTTTGAESWSTYYNQVTAEMYRVFVDNQFPYRVYGSQQDNSTIMVPSRGMPAVQAPQHWAAVRRLRERPHRDRPAEPQRDVRGLLRRQHQPGGPRDGRRAADAPLSATPAGAGAEDDEAPLPVERADPDLPAQPRRHLSHLTVREPDVGRRILVGDDQPRPHAQRHDEDVARGAGASRGTTPGWRCTGRSSPSRSRRTRRASCGRARTTASSTCRGTTGRAG